MTNKEPLISRIRDMRRTITELYPKAYKQGKKQYRIGNIDGAKGHSGIIDTDGKFHDFSSGVSCDIIECIKHVNKCDNKGALIWLQTRRLIDSDEEFASPTMIDNKQPKKLEELTPAPFGSAPPSTQKICRDIGVEHTSAVVKRYGYTNADGQVVMAQCRIDTEEGKKFSRYTWSKDRRSWVNGGTKGKMLPIFNMFNPPEGAKFLLIVEGEKTAQAATNLFSDVHSVSVIDPETTDMTPINECNLPMYVIPDYDKPGYDKAVKLQEGWGAIILSPNLIADHFECDLTKGWDIADIPERKAGEFSVILDKRKAQEAEEEAQEEEKIEEAEVKGSQDKGGENADTRDGSEERIQDEKEIIGRAIIDGLRDRMGVENVTEIGGYWYYVDGHEICCETKEISFGVADGPSILASCSGGCEISESASRLAKAAFGDNLEGLP